MRIVTGVVMVLALGVLTGCGGSGGTGISSITNPPPVNAQTTYSNASVNGTYSVNLGGNAQDAMIGSFKADGNGNLTSGTLTDYLFLSGSGPCAITFTGTYTINSDASGTATITVSSASGSCDTTPVQSQFQFALEAGQQGSTLLFAQSKFATGGGSFIDYGLIGTASKQ